MAISQDKNLRFTATTNKNNSDFITDETNPLFQILANNNYFSYTGIREIFSPTVTLANDDSVFSNIPEQPIISNHSLHHEAVEQHDLNTTCSHEHNHHDSNNDFTNLGLTPQAAASYTNGIEALIGGKSWTNKTITYSFMNQVPDYYANDADERNQFIAFSETQQAAARAALELYSEVSGLNFVEVSDAGEGGTIQFGTANMEHGSAHAYFPSNSSLGGDVWLNNRVSSNLDSSNGSYGFLTLIHEIGHALGLKHPGNYNAGGGGTPAPYLYPELDNYQYSVMSYNQHPGSYVNPQTPMLYDIAAIQHLYGTNHNTRAGNDTYAWDASRAFVHTIWDGGGNDTIDASNQGLAALINLNSGSFSSIGSQTHGNSTSRASNNLAIAYGVTIENAVGGAGNDTLIGNSSSNYLSGNHGNDYLAGYGGYDALIGGSGNDTFALADASSVFYQGDGYAMISDFNWEYDYIQVSGSSNQYSLETGNWTGGSALDTAIYFDNDLIGLVKDFANVSFDRDFVFI
ncbi:metalloprotease [Calothrix parasitica NIES-267]|uniref:Metalloprotease n=1 Tax=Calothrix parasitica NIES-267 TaxID=1973488 RepID=A0A1Z4LJU0_9CYAN|nr:metalloprotease [Calothrix parasitica NIES-267]